LLIEVLRPLEAEFIHERGADGGYRPRVDLMIDKQAVSVAAHRAEHLRRLDAIQSVVTQMTEPSLQ